MSYRIELAKTGRAGCKSGHCKKNDIKIPKGEMRLGVFVEGPQFSSWTWKHWGCVTGAQILNMQNYLAHPTRPGEYRWDFMDGLQDDDDNDCVPPDLQEKFKRAIKEGRVAPEDWRGEPALNLVGKHSKTHYSEADLRKMGVEQNSHENADVEQDTPAKSKSSAKKRGRAKAESDDEDASEPVKKRAKKAKKAEEDDEEQKPTKKSRSKKAKDEDDEADDVKPAKKGRVKKEVDESEDDVKPKPAARKSRAKKVVKTEEDVEELPERGAVALKKEVDGSEDEVKPKPAPRKSKAKKVVKTKEDVEELPELGAVKQEDESEDEIKPKPRPAPRNPRAEKDAARGINDASTTATAGRSKRSRKQENESEDEVKPKPAARKPRGKKAVKTEEDVEEPPERGAVALKKEVDGSEDEVKPKPRPAPRNPRAEKDAAKGIDNASTTATAGRPTRSRAKAIHEETDVDMEEENDDEVVPKGEDKEGIDFVKKEEDEG